MVLPNLRIPPCSENPSALTRSGLKIDLKKGSLVEFEAFFNHAISERNVKFHDDFGFQRGVDFRLIEPLRR